MDEKSQLFWCVRGGEAGQADHTFLKDKYDAIVWPEVGNVAIPPDVR